MTFKDVLEQFSYYSDDSYIRKIEAKKMMWFLQTCEEVVRDIVLDEFDSDIRYDYFRTKNLVFEIKTKFYSNKIIEISLINNQDRQITTLTVI